MTQAGPLSVRAEFTARRDGRVGCTGSAPLAAEPDSGSWTAEIPLDLSALGGGTWDLRLRLHFADGTHRDTTAHAVAGAGLLRRSVLPSTRHGVLLAQPYATHAGALALRLAPGWRGATDVVLRRLRRLLH
jgi:hypothetical protein